jgi:preprotein translocase subunit SecG
MIKFLFIFQIVLAVILTIIILLQKSSSIGFGAYSGSNESLFGAKGPQGFLSKVTFILSAIFVINTILLGYIYNKEYNKSIVDEIKVKEEKKIPSPKIPLSSVPQAPSKK